jgi:hypothetical protein
MPILIRCPSCERQLRVPDKLLGKMVKCPSCQARFTAEPEGPEPEEGAEEAPPERPVGRRRAPPAEEGVTERPSRSGRSPADEEEPDEEEEEEERPRRRRRRRGRRWRYSGAAASAVTGPAIALMIVGGLGIGVAALSLVLRILNVGMMAANQGGAPPGGNPHDEAFRAGVILGGTLGIVIDVFGILWGIFVLLGAIQMKALKNHGLAITTCIIAMIPGNCCCLLGLPFGIWGLAVINRPEVKDAFG